MVLEVTERGLYCAAGNFYVDPLLPVERALITHGHADHAVPGHDAVLATPETLAIMALRHGEAAPKNPQPINYGEVVDHFGVRLSFHPAGHVLGSAQILIEHAGERTLISGDFKRRPDPTCPPYQVVHADRLVIEATFGLPIFRHPPVETQIAALLASQKRDQARAQLVGVYPLGKCQRVIKLLREAGWDAPIYLHGALLPLTRLYREHGVELGEIRPATETKKAELVGQIVLAPPGALSDRWTRRLPDPVIAYASGFMQIRARARQRGVELPLVISDHADWSELTQTILDSQAREIWVTHGLGDGLVHFARGKGLAAKTLEIRGYEEEEVAA